MIEDAPAMALPGKLLPDLPDSEREQLQSAISELFSRQAIVRDLHGDRDLYDWTRSHFPWVREVCALIGFEVILNEDDQLIYALPGERVTLRRLRVEWTLVLLSLWYDYDVQLRAEGSPVIFSVEAFNESLRDKIGERQPSLSSLRDILAFFASRKLVRMDYGQDFHRSTIEVLPT
ncbi:MAG: DUF4194 domain-containing protein, partial [Chthoniobacterales bacterium]